MARFSYQHFSPNSRRNCKLLLASVWFSGLGLGIVLFRTLGSSLTFPVSGALSDRASMVSLLGCLLIPFLFSACAVYIAKPRLLYLICFLKALTFTWISCMILHSFGSAGWLVQGLLLFSGNIANSMLYYFWMYHLSGGQQLSGSMTLSILISYIALTALDFHFIAPLLEVFSVP